ncbi:MAG: hypothetical protein ABUS56_07305 [Acidobacteriota bacterium]
MTRRSTAFASLLSIVLTSLPVLAQESQVAADLRREREHVADSCGTFAPKAIAGCAYTLTTESPLHIALGSLAPTNGFAFGLAFDEHYTPNEAWRISWSADAVAAPSGAWRSGAYMRLVHTPATAGVVVRQPGTPAPRRPVTPRAFAVLDLFAQTISLKTINYFGQGPDTVESGRAVFGERETVLGVSAVYPLDRVSSLAALHPALLGGVTGRFVSIRAAPSGQAPSIEQRYDDVSAPGLAAQDGFVELREGVRLEPSVANGRLRFNYLLSAQQFRTSAATRASFNRWTLDLRHDIPLYHAVSSTGPRAFNGPNACAQSSSSAACPPVQWSRNRQGTIALRLYASASTTSGDNRVPFYLQPTLGGSDINGDRVLASYQNYRFRGPNVVMLQEGLEHSIWGPFGAYVLAEQGKATESLGSGGLATSTTVGVTLRAGGFPLVNLSFSWGGEGHHIIGAMDTSLLGGSPRPSLY